MRKVLSNFADRVIIASLILRADWETTKAIIGLPGREESDAEEADAEEAANVVSMELYRERKASTDGR